MSALKDQFWSNIYNYEKFARIEQQLIKTLLVAGNENAYNIWKDSGLKHYPTVLRTLKKMQKRHLLNSRENEGTRKTVEYNLTLRGLICWLIFVKDKHALFDILETECSRFHALVDNNLNGIDTIASQLIGSYLYYSSQEKNRTDFTFNQIIEDDFNDKINDDLLTLSRKDSQDELIEFSKIPWVKEAIIRVLKANVDWTNQLLIDWGKLKKTLQL
jgi:DNA-binding MarR family transcriptional regulator